MTNIHYVQMLYQGLAVSETSERSVESRDPSIIQVPREAFGFRFFDRNEVRDGGETLHGEPKNHSGIFYVGGQIMTLKEVRQKMPEKEILIQNMKSNGLNKVVKTRHGQVMQFNKEDKVLEDRV